MTALLSSLGSLVAGCSGIGIVGLFAVAVVAFALHQRRKFTERMAEAGAALGLSLDPGGWLRRPTLSGDLDGSWVVVDTYTRSSGKNSQLWSRVRVTTGAPLVLRRETMWSTLTGAVLGEDVATGDAAFDGDVYVEGDGATVTCALDADTRRGVRALLAEGAVHQGGGWSHERLGEFSSAAEIVNRVRRMAATGDALGRGPTPDSLRERAARDPDPGVRAVATERLLAALGDGAADPGWLDALAAELTEPLAQVRIAALRGPAGHEVLRAHLGHPDRRAARVAALALAAGAEPGTDPALEGALAGLLPDAEAIAALGRIGSVSSVAALRPLAERYAFDGSASAAQRAIRAIQSRVVGGGRGALAVAEVAGGELADAAGTEAGALAEAARTPDDPRDAEPRRAAARLPPRPQTQ